MLTSLPWGQIASDWWIAIVIVGGIGIAYGVMETVDYYRER